MILVYRKCMTRKRIDLDLATMEWLAGTIYRDRAFERDITRYHPDRQPEERTKRLRSMYLSAALGDISVSRVSVETFHPKITFTTRSLNAKDLNRLMNSEIHLDGKTYVFSELSPTGHEEGDIYWGEHTSYAVHEIEVEFRLLK